MKRRLDGKIDPSRHGVGPAGTVLTSDGMNARWQAGGGDSDHPGTGADSTQIGPGAVASGVNSFAAGHSSTASATGALAIGYFTTATGSATVGVGVGVEVAAAGGTAIGYGAWVPSGADDAIVIGRFAEVSATAARAITIGANHSNSTPDSCSIKANELEMVRSSGAPAATSLILSSPDGTRYRLAPPNGGGAASWVAA